MHKTFSIIILAITVALSLQSQAVNASIPFFNSSKNDTPTLAPMLEQVTPAVVSISVAGTQVSNSQIPEMFQHFFGPGQQRQERPFKGLGSGVIIDSDKGYVVTNAHVINNADKISVNLQDGRELLATLVGQDPQSDVALLQIDAEDLIAASIADSDALRVGDFAIAIGNPFGIGQTVTSGIVSALGRSGLSRGGYEDFIQTDAAINRGNSGGALINLKGELIGINTAIIGPSGGNVGIGFAIPSNMMVNLVEQLKDHGEIRRGLLGIMGADVDGKLAKAMALVSTQGAIVTQVTPDSSAELAGIVAGDVIVSLNGKDIKNFPELRAKIGTMGAGTEVLIGYERDQEVSEVLVSLGDYKASNMDGSDIHRGLGGALLSDGETDDNSSGVIISEIQRNSPAYASGLRQGDVIVGVNRRRTESLAELRDLFEDNDSVASLNLKRGDSTLYLILR